MSFETNLANFLAKCDEVFQAVNAKSNYQHYGPVSTESGPKYVRVVRSSPDGSSRSVFCFVRKEDGAILKAAGWKAPAKGERGNINNPETFQNLDPYGSWLYR
jgi:hypothetical protein